MQHIGDHRHQRSLLQRQDEHNSLRRLLPPRPPELKPHGLLHEEDLHRAAQRTLRGQARKPGCPPDQKDQPDKQLPRKPQDRDRKRSHGPVEALHDTRKGAVRKGKRGDTRSRKGDKQGGGEAVQTEREGDRVGGELLRAAGKGTGGKQ